MMPKGEIAGGLVQFRKCIAKTFSNNSASMCQLSYKSCMMIVFWVCFSYVWRQSHFSDGVLDRLESDVETAKWPVQVYVSWIQNQLSS